jgi:hypothetical protein
MVFTYEVYCIRKQTGQDLNLGNPVLCQKLWYNNDFLPIHSQHFCVHKFYVASTGTSENPVETVVVDFWIFDL